MVRILDMAMSSSASLRRESASQRFDAGVPGPNPKNSPRITNELAFWYRRSG